MLNSEPRYLSESVARRVAWTHYRAGARCRAKRAHGEVLKGQQVAVAVPES